MLNISSLSNAIILIGIGCIVTAIVGSGIKISKIKMGPIPSLRRQVLLAAFGVLLIGTGLVAQMRSSGIKGIETTSLAPNQRVAPRESVGGRAPPGTQQIWLIVHPREIDGCWAQGPGTADDDGNWQIMGHFGEVGAQHAGKLYEVRAIAGPRLSPERQLEVGPVGCGLDARLSSAWVNVVRM
jgi:hypothetical protein